MNREDLLAGLDRRPLLCDGAMGTQLIACGLPAGYCGELWNVEKPDEIAAIHLAYADAGANLITTNTFGANRPSLEKHGLGKRVVELNRAGASNARRAIGKDRWVLGDLGPFGGFLEPLGEMSVKQLHDIFFEQAEALYTGGADAIIVETMVAPAELTIAVSAAKQAGGGPVLATFAFNRSDPHGYRTIMGTTVEQAIKAAMDAGADVVGANCGTSLDLEDYVRLAEQIVAAAGSRPRVIIQPNAGAPTMSNGKLIHPATPEQMAQLIGPLLDAGVRIIGGCCGTTPAHIRAMRSKIA